MANRAKKYHFILSGLGIAFFLISGWILNMRLEALRKDNLKNKQTLTLALSGFNKQSPEELRQEIRSLKEQLVNISGIFDPKEKWLKKDYDLSIYFVEEMGKADQFLKAKAAEKKVDFQELGFKEKLPSESEAFFLLSQLYGLKETVSLGLDYSVNFKTIEPLSIENAGGMPEVKLAKSHIGLVCPEQSLIDFIIKLCEIIPRPYTETLFLKFQGSSFEMDLALDNIIVDLDWKDREGLSVSSVKEVLSEAEQNFIRNIRSRNPFLILTAKDRPAPDEEQAQTGASVSKPKQLPRFFFRGKATLKSKEVVIIEDALNQETLFLAKGQRIDNFIVKGFTSEQAVLKNLGNNKEIIIKREE